MNVTSVLRECTIDLLDTEDKVDVEQVVTCAYIRHGDVFTEATARLVRDAARRIVRELLRDISSGDDDGQLSFPAMPGLPTAIAVPSPDGTYYVRQDKALWIELRAGRSVREENVERAQAKLDMYDEALKRLRPFMENDEKVTVAQAVARLEAAA